MQFRVLGTVEVLDRSGRAVPLAGGRQRLLLATLLAHRGREVSADALIDSLWGEDLPAHPAAALQSQVHRLRRVLVSSDEAQRQIRDIRHRIVDSNEDFAKLAVGRGRKGEAPLE